MAYTAINNGDDIDWQPPVEPKFSPYQMVWRKEPKGIAVPELIWTNNPIQIATKETMYEKSEVGVATVQTFLAYMNTDIANRLCMEIVGANMDDITKKKVKFDRKKALIGDKLFPMQEILPNVLDPDKSTVKPKDAAMAIQAQLRSLGAALAPRDVYVPPDGKIRSWFTPEFRKMAFDTKQYEEALDEIQDTIYNNFQRNPEAGINRHVVGAALLEKNEGNPKLADHGLPGMITKINKRTSFELKFDVRRTHYREERYNLVYTSPSDLFLRKFFYAEGYEYEDYVAFNNFINSMFSDYGAPAFQNWLTMQDINKRVLMMFGTGLRQMDPLKAIEQEIMTDLFDWALLKGIELARTTPMSDSVTVHLDSWELRPHEKIQKAMAYPADFVKYGTKTVPHLPQPTNWIGPGQFMMPCAVRHSRLKRGWRDYENTLEHIIPEEWPNKVPLTVTGGTTRMPPSEGKIQHFLFTFTSDAAHGEKIVGDKKRRLYYIRVPSNPLYMVKLPTDKKRFLWLMSLLCSGTQTMGMGFKVEPFFDMVYPSKVTRIHPDNLYIDGYGELRIKGEPDAIPGAGAVDLSKASMLNRPGAPSTKPKDLEHAPAFGEVIIETPEKAADIADDRGARKAVPTHEELTKQYADESAEESSETNGNKK